MAIFKRGRYYHYDFELNGHRYYGSTKRTSKQKAENAVAVLRRRILDGVQGVPNSKSMPPFSAFADRFLEWAKANLANETAHLHEINIASLKKFFHGKLLTEITPGDVEEFKIWRSKQLRKNGKDRPVMPPTFNRNLTTLKRIFSYADALEMNVWNPVRRVKFLRESPGRMRVLSIEEVDEYLAVAKGDVHDFALLMIQTGGRPEEILSLHKVLVNLEQEFVSLPGTKTEPSRRDVPLMQEGLEVLQRRCEASRNGYISPLRRPKTKKRQVGHTESLLKAHNAVVKKHFTDTTFVPYTFRHTFATRCIEAGVGIVELSALLGHTDLATTMRYVHVLKEQKVQAVGKLEGYIKIKERLKLGAEEDEEKPDWQSRAEIIEKAAPPDGWYSP